MEEERLTGTAVMNIHLDVSDISDRFASKKPKILYVL